MTLLENIHIILEKTPQEDITTDILPIIYSGLESSTVQVQVAAVVAATNASEYLDSEAIKKTVLPRTKAIYEQNPTDVALCLTVLGCIERILDKLERAAIIDDVLPILSDVKLQDADVTVKVVRSAAQNIYEVQHSERHLQVLRFPAHTIQNCRDYAHKIFTLQKPENIEELSFLQDIL